MSSKAGPQQRVLVVGLISLGILFTAFFGMRALHAFRRFNGHRPPPPNTVETDVELIRDWMTVPFVSRMYQIPDEIIFESLEISPKNNRDKSLMDLNQEFYPNTEGYVLDKVKTTILAHQPPPTPAASRDPSADPPSTTLIAP
ncbi:MAG TPA: hypothetical protein VFI68_14930 [Anaerolineales bacterium]|nr:hypothetical protein [Anaerolineales bacterium]